MLAYRNLEHYDDFGDAVVCWVDVSNVPEELVREARQIDGDDYLDGCFGVCLNYDKEKRKFAPVEDSSGSHLYYVDNNGNKHWFEYRLEEQEVELLAQYVRPEIEREQDCGGKESGA